MNIDMSYPEFPLDYNSVATAEDWDYLNSFQASMEMPYSSVAVPEDWDYLNSFQAPMEMQNDDIWSELFADVKNEALNEKNEDPNDEELLEDLCSLLVDPDDVIQENNPLCDDQCQQLSPISTSSSSMYVSESSCSTISPRDKNEKKKKNKEEKMKKCEREKRVTRRIAFKPKSERDSFEDGYKWRKYGKKMLRSTPFPRNYYKCRESGCQVKKRVEQDISDPSLLVVTYEGKHNHQSPFRAYYIDEPMLFSQPGSTSSVFIVSNGNFPEIL